MSAENGLFPVHVFRFDLDFFEDRVDQAKPKTDPVPVCSGSFSECTGLEATMEPKVIREGGRNYGAAQRAGPVTFSTVILRRGMTKTRHLWQWFELVSHGAYAHRLAARIYVQNARGDTVLTWQLRRAMPVKFKAADLNARGTEIGIEELHLVHEGLTLVR